MALVAFTSIDSLRAPHTADVRAVLRKIAQLSPRVGGLLIGLVRSGPHTVKIRPFEDNGYQPHMELHDFLGADVDPRSDRVHAYRPGLPVLVAGGRRRRGTGRGAGGIIWFTGRYFPVVKRAPFPGDVYIVHELVHTFAYMQGIQDNRTTPRGADFDYHTVAEFWAILVENMYRSEAGYGLRWDHHAICHYDRVDRPMNRPSRGIPRVDDEVAMVEEMWRLWRGRDRLFLHRLRSLPLRFNPFRDYMRPDPVHAPERGVLHPGSSTDCR